MPSAFSHLATVALVASALPADALARAPQRTSLAPASAVDSETSVRVQVAGEPLEGQPVLVVVNAPAGARLRVWIEDPRALSPARSIEGVADERGRWSHGLRAPEAGTRMRFQAEAWTAAGRLRSAPVVLTAEAPYEAQPGDVRITEVLAAPRDVADAAGEWIELHNRTSYDLDLQGWTLRDESGEFHVIDEPVILASRTYGVLAIDGDPARNGGVAALYTYDSIFLDDRVDQVILASREGRTIDRVDYDLRSRAGLPEPGAALGFAPSARTGVSSGASRLRCIQQPGRVSPGLPNPCCGQAGAEDVPDLDFLDTNCDGIDGDVARAVFVAPSGALGNAGTMDAPLPDVQTAILLASQDATKDHVYVSAGTYVGTLVLADGVSVFGGYSADNGWERSGEFVTTIRAEGPVTEGMVGVRGTALTAPVTLGGLRVETADAPAGSGMHNYGVLLHQSADVRLEDVAIDAGDGAAGMAGADGQVGADGYDGWSGTTRRIWVPGYWILSFWVPGYWYTEFDVGGAGGNGASRGGSGGNGGAWDGYGGYAGVAAPGKSSAPGGAGGRWIGVGRLGGWGAGGFYGSGFVAPSNEGALVAGTWVVDGFGPDGASGGPGSGGGGGGGGSGTFGNQLGLGGGGGGGGGWGGGGGRGGGPAGSSLALFVSQSSVALEACTVLAGNGGGGGNGGDGGFGGSGGAGGDVRPEAGRVYGGSGGYGGWGGDGGAGTGGGGGHSYGVLRDSASSVLMTASQVASGTAGLGGLGGYRYSSPRYDGQPGQAAAVRQL